MGFSLEAKAVGIGSGKKQELSRVNKVQILRENLIKEGYQPSETEHFVKTILGTTNISEMRNEQLDILIERLEEQLNFARKCRSIFRS